MLITQILSYLTRFQCAQIRLYVSRIHEVKKLGVICSRHIVSHAYIRIHDKFHLPHSLLSHIAHHSPMYLISQINANLTTYMKIHVYCAYISEIHNESRSLPFPSRSPLTVHFVKKIHVSKYIFFGIQSKTLNQ